MTRDTRHARSETDAREALGFDREGVHEARSDQQLLEAVQQAINRDRMVRQQRAEPTKLRLCDKSRTRREREVMMLVVTGSLNRQIAAQLRTSELDHGSPSTDDA